MSSTIVMPSTISTAGRLWRTFLAPNLARQWPRIVVALYCIRGFYTLPALIKDAEDAFDTDAQSIAQDGKNDTASSELEDNVFQQQMILSFQILASALLGSYNFLGLYAAVRKSILASKINLLFSLVTMLFNVLGYAMAFLLFLIRIKTRGDILQDIPQDIDFYIFFCKLNLAVFLYGWASFVMLRDYQGYRNRNVFGFMRRQTEPEAITIEKKSLLL
ncbi:hypothetical protein BGZ94_006394 [Podila epigama]|nr:hypothetical protein BGZ94_006394 [Podila epigama]